MKTRIFEQTKQTEYFNDSPDQTLDIKHETHEVQKWNSVKGIASDGSSIFQRRGGANSREMRPGDIFPKNCMKTRMHSSRMRTVRRSSSRLLGSICLSACSDTHPPGLGLDTPRAWAWAWTPPGPGPGHPPPARPPNLPLVPSTPPLDPTMYAIVLWCKEEQSLNPFAAIRFSRE